MPKNGIVWGILWNGLCLGHEFLELVEIGKCVNLGEIFEGVCEGFEMVVGNEGVVGGVGIFVENVIVGEVGGFEGFDFEVVGMVYVLEEKGGELGGIHVFGDF
jgi:hypothetical protein